MSQRYEQQGGAQGFQQLNGAPAQQVPQQAPYQNGAYARASAPNPPQAQANLHFPGPQQQQAFAPVQNAFPAQPHYPVAPQAHAFPPPQQQQQAYLPPPQAQAYPPQGHPPQQQQPQQAYPYPAPHGYPPQAQQPYPQQLPQQTQPPSYSPQQARQPYPYPAAAVGQQQLQEAQHKLHQQQQELAQAQKELKAAAYKKGKEAARAEMEEKQKSRDALAALDAATVIPFAKFDPEEDCKALRKAMKGIGCDKKVVTEIIGKRSNAQRQKLIEVFKKLFGRDLVKDLKSETSGSYQDLVLALMRTPSSFDAFCLRKAMKGLGTDEKTLTEIICTRTPQQLEAIKNDFYTEFRRNLVDDVTSETKKLIGKSHFKDILVGLLTEGRDQDGAKVDQTKTALDAQILYAAGEAKWGTDEKKFVEIFTRRSFAHLRQVFVEYQKLSSYDIHKSIKREMSGDLRHALQAIVGASRDLNEFFAVKLKESMDGLGTDESKLTRIVVSRSEIDLGNIKDEFTRRKDCGEGKTLAKWIKGDASGNYRKLLHLVMGAEMAL